MSLVQRSSLTAVGTRGSLLLDHFAFKWITFTLSKTSLRDINSMSGVDNAIPFASGEDGIRQRGE
jgi:hypothetical protein